MRGGTEHGTGFIVKKYCEARDEIFSEGVRLGKILDGCGLDLEEVKHLEEDEIYAMIMSARRRKSGKSAKEIIEYLRNAADSLERDFPERGK